MSDDDPYKPPQHSSGGSPLGRIRPLWAAAAFFPVYMGLTLVVSIPAAKLGASADLMDGISMLLLVVSIPLSIRLMLRKQTSDD